MYIFRYIYIWVYIYVHIYVYINPATSQQVSAYSASALMLRGDTEGGKGALAKMLQRKQARVRG